MNVKMDTRADTTQSGDDEVIRIAREIIDMVESAEDAALLSAILHVLKD